MHKDDHARLTRRIESFSDLVIGFSLALLALTLVIPEHTYLLFSNPFWLGIYLWTFAVVAAIWFSHQRVFSAYFVPSRLTVFLNFVLLSLLGLVVFSVQVFGHVPREDKALAFLSYWALLGTEFAILSALYGIGVRTRWPDLDVLRRREGVEHCVRSLLLAAGAYLGIGVTLLVGGMSMERSYLIALPVVAAGLLSRYLKGYIGTHIDA